MQTSTLLRLTVPRYRLPTSAPWRIGYFVLLSTVAYYPALALAASINDFRDAQFLALYEASAVRTVLRYGQLPLWDPSYCGGLYALGLPQSRFATPVFLLSLLLGAERAVSATATLLTVFGMEGFYRYFRARGVLAKVALLVAPIFPLTGYFSASYFPGWIISYGLQALPWALLGLHEALHNASWSRRSFFLFGAAFAFMIGFGGTYSVPQAALVCTVEVFFAFFLHRSRVRAPQFLGRCCALGLVALGLSSYRLLPIVDVLSAAPRVMSGNPSIDPNTLWQKFVGLAVPHDGELYGTGFLFVGFPVVVLTGFSWLVCMGTRRWRFAIPVGFAVPAFLWLGVGYYSPHFSLFGLLRQAPVWDTLRYPERFALPAVVFAAQIVAHAGNVLVVSWRRMRPTRWWVRILPVLVGCAWLVLCQVGVALQVHNTRVAVGGTPVSREVAVALPHFEQARGNRWLAAHYAALNLGSLSCAEGFPVSMSDALDPSSPMMRVVGRGRARMLVSSPNRLQVEVAAEETVQMVFNQNWHPGWHADFGRTYPDRGRLALEIPAGTRRVTLRFIPRSAWIGFAITVWTVVALWYAVKSGTRRRVALALALALIGVAFFVWPEHAATASVLNADGEPVFVDVLPPNAHPLSAHIEAASLVGASLPDELDEYGIAHFSLYWSFSERMDRDVAVFVHIVRAGNLVANADHDVIGASYLLSKVPTGRLLRDNFARVLPPGDYSLYVGLWSSTTGARLSVPDSGENRVFVGSFTLRPGSGHTRDM